MLAGQGTFLAAASSPNGIQLGGSNQSGEFAGRLTAGTLGTYAGNPTARRLTLTKSGSGVLTLSGESDFAGQVRVAGGTLRVPLLTDRGPTLPGPLGLGNLDDPLLGADLVLGAAPSTLGTLEFTGAAASTDRSVLLAGAGGMNVAAADAQLHWRWAISGAGALVKQGPGTLLLTGPHAHAGGTTIQAGVLETRADAALGTGPIRLGGGTWRVAAAPQSYANSLALTAPSTIDAQVDLTLLAQATASAQSLRKTGPGVVRVHASFGASLTGAVLIDQGRLEALPGAGDLWSAGTTLHIGAGAVVDESRGNGEEFGGLAGGGTYLAAANQANGVRLGTNHQDTAFSGLLTAGAAGLPGATPALRALPQLRKLGTGVTTLTGAFNDFAAPVQIDSGVLSVDRLGPRGLAGPLGLGNVAGGGGIDLTLGSGATPGTLRYTGPSTATDRTISLAGPGAIDVTDPAAVLAFSGTIGGSRSLTKSGPGSLRLGAASSFSGGTQLLSGTLLVENTSGSALGSGPVQVAAGAVLAGNGSIAGAVTSAGVIAPGESVGLLSARAVALVAGGGLLVEVQGDQSDYLLVNELLDLSGDDDALWVNGALDGRSEYLVAGYGARRGFFNHVHGLPPEYVLDYDNPTRTVRLRLVPEPAPLALVLAAATWWIITREGGRFLRRETRR
jgi:autotransporter-associated beta strand protein